MKVSGKTKPSHTELVQMLKPQDSKQEEIPFKTPEKERKRPRRASQGNKMQKILELEKMDIEPIKKGKKRRSSTIQTRRTSLRQSKRRKQKTSVNDDEI